MGEGKYVPSPEEMKKAEDIMTPVERELSQERSEVMDAMEAKGLKITKEKHDHYHDGPYEVVKISGKLKGHNISLKLNDRVDSYTGSVDGIKLSEEDAEVLFKKYNPDTIKAREDFHLKKVAEETTRKSSDPGLESNQERLKNIKKDLGF